MQLNLRAICLPYFLFKGKMSQSVPLILQEDCERGEKSMDDSIENDFAYRNNVLHASKAIRMGFIRKVYGLLTMQLLLTVIVASMCMFTPQIKSFIHTKYVKEFCTEFNVKQILLLATG